MTTQEKAREEIKKLVEKYHKLVDSGKLRSYNEEMTKKGFIEPLFRALGWDIEDGEEVSAEEKVSRGRVDYAFRIDGIPKFFLEAKALKVDLEKAEFAEQAINYAWHKGATWAVLTDFEGIKVFNAEIKYTNPLQSMFFGLHWHQYLDQFDRLWLLSRESFEQGTINKVAEGWGKKAKKLPVDKQLLQDLTKFRELLTKNILKNNAPTKLTEEDLDESVQRIIDRLIFIRTLEDKELEPPVLLAIIREDRHKTVIKKLVQEFRKIDHLYNSKLFEDHLCEHLIIDDNVLEIVIDGLFKTKDGTTHYDFSAIDADVLGNIYEQYLSHILKKTKQKVALKEKKSHRKEQGIYYTPTYVVDYIVKNTIGELAKDKKFDISNITILDPACGSGSFLIKAFDYLVTLKSKKGGLEQTKLALTGETVTYSKKVGILKSNIFGVDLDAKAVEIAQLNLLLKVAEKKHRLPMLQNNVRIGNALIDDPNIVGDKAFSWESSFQEIMKNGGFDVIIGNPPYGREQIDTIHKQGYAEADDIYTAFILRCMNLLKDDGYLGFIVPVSWQTGERYRKFREKIFDYLKITKIINLPFDVFEDAYVDTGIIIFRKNKPVKKFEIYSFPKSESSKRLVGVEQRMESVDLNLVMHDPFKRIFPFPSVYRILEKIKKTGKTILLGEITKSAIGILASKYKIADKKMSNAYFPFFVGNFYRYKLKKPGLKYVDFTKHLGKDYTQFYTGKRILVRRIINRQNRLMASISNEDFVTKKDLYSFKILNSNFNIKYILALLNSKLFSYLYISTSTIATKDDFRQTTLSELRRLPIMTVSKQQQEELVKQVDKILQLNKRLNQIGEKKTDERARLETEIKDTDVEIDVRVFKIYGITEKEKKIIDEILK